jgi:hypothetical protein
MNASATARLEGGLAIELLTQARKTTNPPYDWAIKKLIGVSTGSKDIISGLTAKCTALRYSW